MTTNHAFDAVPHDFINQYQSRIDDGELKLPLLPDVASKVLRLAASDSGSAAEFSDLIHKDQALAGQVLRVANSAIFARRGNIVSLKQAVTRLGLDLLSEIAMTAMMADNVFKGDAYKDELRAVWRHALATGCFAKEIARQGRRNVESAFLCGLLHTVGKPVALNTILELAGQTGVAVEKEAVLYLLDTTHQRVGTQVAEAWRMPQPVVVSIMYHQDYTGDGPYRTEAMVTYLASIMANWLLDRDEQSEEEIRKDPVLRELNLYPDDLDALLGMEARIMELVDSLDQGAA